MFLVETCSWHQMTFRSGAIHSKIRSKYNIVKNYLVLELGKVVTARLRNALLRQQNMVMRNSCRFLYSTAHRACHWKKCWKTPAVDLQLTFLQSKRYISSIENSDGTRLVHALFSLPHVIICCTVLLITILHQNKAFPCVSRLTNKTVHAACCCKLDNIPTSPERQGLTSIQKFHALKIAFTAFLWVKPLIDCNSSECSVVALKSGDRNAFLEKYWSFELWFRKGLWIS